eukprot:767213-Hanusia_phi.AAC.4
MSGIRQRIKNSTETLGQRRWRLEEIRWEWTSLCVLAVWDARMGNETFAIRPRGMERMKRRIKYSAERDEETQPEKCLSVH